MLKCPTDLSCLFKHTIRETQLHPTCVKSKIILHLHSPAAIVKTVSTLCITLFPIFHLLFNISISSTDIFPNNRLLTALCFLTASSSVHPTPNCVAHKDIYLPPPCSFWSSLHLRLLCLQAPLGIVLHRSLVVTSSFEHSYYCYCYYHYYSWVLLWRESAALMQCIVCIVKIGPCHLCQSSHLLLSLQVANTVTDDYVFSGPFVCGKDHACLCALSVTWCLAQM